MSRIIAELAVQADTRELERAAKLFDEFSDAVKKGGKDAGKAYEDSLGAIDKLILKSSQLKKAQLDEKDIDEAKKYTKAIVEIDKQIAKVTGRLVQQKTATNELARGERAQAGILAQLLDREARLVRLRQQANSPTRLAAFNKELANTRKKIDDINKASRPKGGIDANGTAALLGSLGGGASGIAGALGGLAGGPIGAAVAGLTVDLGGALISTSKNALNAAAEMEGLKTQIQAFVGVKVGTDIFREIEQFAIKNPVANLQESLRATAMLLQEGFSAKESVDIVKQLTDVTKGNTDKFKDLSLALSQVKSAGRLMGQELNQLRNGGFNPLVEISKKTGESMAQLKKRMEAGGVSAKEVADALKDATSEGGRFYNMSNNLSGTVTGNMAAIEDSTTKLSASFGNFVNKYGGSAFLQWLNKATLGLSNFFDSFNSGTLEGQISDAFNSLDSLNSKLGDISSSRKASIKDYIAALKAGLSEEDAIKRARNGITKEEVKLANSLYANLLKEEKDYQASLSQSRERFSGLGISKLFDFTKKQETTTEKAAKTLADIEADEAARRSFLIDKKSQEDLTNQEKYELKRLILKKKSNSEISDAEKKALKDLNNEQKQADQKYIDDVNKASKELEKAYADRQARIASLNDKIALQAIGKAETEQSIRERYKIELNAELREIEASKKAVEKEIVPITAEQKALKIKLLQSYEDEKLLITEYYQKVEITDITEHNKQLAEIKAGFDADLLKLSRENKESELQLTKLTFENEMEALRLRNRIEKDAINESYDAQKKAIEDSVLLAEDKKELITKLDFERNVALLNADRMQAEKRLEISDRYFETYLSDLEAFNNAQLTKQDNADRIARISLQDALNKGLISRKEYYKKLDQLEKEAILRQKQNRIAQIVGEVAVINEQQAPVTTKSGTRKQISDAESKALDERKKALIQEAEQLGIELAEITVNTGTEVQNKQKEQLQAALDFSVQMVQIGADAMRSITDAQLASIDNLISVQQSRLDNARALAEAGFTDSLQKEQDRIEVLQQKREAIIRRQIILDNIARISSQTLAVANTIAGASTPPTPATPFLIAASVASVLATIGASIAQARSFNTGTAWLTPQNSSQGRRTDDIPAFLNKGEGIIPTKPNERFNPITQAMIANDPKKIAFAAMQHPEIKKHIFNDYSFALSKANSAGNSTVKEIDRLKSVIDRMEQAIGGITIVNNNAQLNFDADGASKYMTKRQQKLADIRNKIK